MQPSNLIDSLSFTYTANGQTSDSSWEFLKIECEQIETAQKIIMNKKLRETMCRNMKVGDKKRENLFAWYKFAFVIWRNLSNVGHDEKTSESW